jgi:hypothetical protein
LPNEPPQETPPAKRQTEREKYFDGQPLERIADVMAGCQPNSTNDQTSRAEFLLRQTQFQKEAAEASRESAGAAREMADYTKKYTRYMFWSVVVLAASSLGSLTIQIIQIFQAKP